MEAFYLWQSNINLFVQSVGTWLVGPMTFFSYIGQDYIYQILFPLLYWCLDSRLGMSLGLLLSVNLVSNTFFKFLFHAPRPMWVNPQVKALSLETTFGIPSGHSQTAAAIFGLLAHWTRDKRLLYSGALIVFIVGLSRIFLGAHFLTDVLAGWLLGALIAWLFVRYVPRVAPLLARLSLARLLLLAVLTSLVLMLTCRIPLALLPFHRLPQQWATNAAMTQPEVELEPFDVADLFSAGGSWLGLLAGAAWTYKTRGRLDVRGPWLQRGLRGAVGLIGVILPRIALSSAMPDPNTYSGYALRYAIYLLIGFWITALAPRLFVRLGLARFLDPGPCK